MVIGEIWSIYSGRVSEYSLYTVYYDRFTREIEELPALLSLFISHLLSIQQCQN
jgi:hypothetical protein